LLNNIVDTKRILLDERVEMKVAVNPHNESIIYCRPFEEDMHNVSAFTIHGQEFVHNYSVDSDNQKYIVTNIITEDGDIYEDVKFKLVVVENGLLPMSTVNLGLTHNIPPAKPANSPVPLNESAVNEKLKEYKLDLLTEFLAFTHEQKELLRKYIDERVESVVAQKIAELK
jgi:hypothetical protein